MPRGRGPDLSQRPRREAPGMLTALAILERELGLVEYRRHVVKRQLAARPSVHDSEALQAELAELERRRRLTVRLLDERHEAGTKAA